MRWIVIIVCVIMWLTCPDKADHQRAVNDKIKEMCSADKDTAIVSGFLALAGCDVGDIAGKFVQVDNYKNWVLFSTAKVMDVNTLGVFGNVFFLGGNGDGNASQGENRTTKTEKRYKYVYSEGNNCHIWCKGQGIIDGKKMDAELYVRYRDSDKWQVYVDFGIKLFSASPVSAVCRCGVGDWHHEAWNSSSSAESTFYNGDRVDLVNEMRKHSHFEMSVKAANGSSCSASFDGVGEKVQELINYYNENIKN